MARSKIQSAIEILDEIRRETNRVSSSRSVGDWIEKHIRLRASPLGTRVDLDWTPWLREPLAALVDKEVREVAISAAAQMGKSVLSCAYCCWVLAEKKESTLFVLDTEKQGQIFNQTKLFPMLRDCEPLKALLPKSRTEFRQGRIHFPQNDLLTGGTAPSFLRSHSVGVVIGDEVARWGDGAMANARARTTQFPNRKLLWVSTPLESGSDFSNIWRQGHQASWSVKCQGCGELFVPKFDRLKWEKGKDDETDWKRIEETLRMVCPKCQHEHRQDAKTMRRMNDGGGYISENEDAPRSIRSFHFNKLVLGERIVPWIDVVGQFIQARKSADAGYLAPMREWINLTLGEFWESEDKYGTALFSLADEKEEMDGDVYRVMSVDCQKDLSLFYGVIRDWGRSGDSQLVHFFQASSFDEVEEIKEKYKVESRRVLIDCAYQQTAVITQACNRGWLPLRGTSRTEFSHKIYPEGSKRAVYLKKLYSGVIRASHVRLEGNRQAYYIQLATSPLRDLFIALRDKKVKGVKWDAAVSACGGMPQEYVSQIHAFKREQVSLSQGKQRYNPTQTRQRWVQVREDDHAADCEVMQCAGALLLNLDWSKRSGIGERKVIDKKRVDRYA